MYGGHITDYFDMRTNNTYLANIFNHNLTKNGELLPSIKNPDSASFTESDYTDFISRSLPEETPSLYGTIINRLKKYYIVLILHIKTTLFDFNFFYA